MSSKTYRLFYHRRPVVVPFEAIVKIGGTFRWEARRGRTTQRSRVMGLGEFFRSYYNNHVVEILDKTDIKVRFKGEYTGAIGEAPGIFRCEAKGDPI